MVNTINSLRSIDRPIQNKGAGSRRPIRRIVWRRRYDADARGEVHFTLAEHDPKPGFTEGRLYLHLHVEQAVTGYAKSKPAALNVPQLAGLIRSLQEALDEMATIHPCPAPKPGASDDAEPQPCAQR